MYSIPNLHLEEGLQIDKIKRFNIRMDNKLYRWGQGWVSDTAKREFDLYILTIFKAAGYQIKMPDISGGCYEIVLPYHDKATVYMHPLEFSGFALPEDIEKIYYLMRTLDMCSNFSVKIWDIYDVSDSKYRSILAQHAKEILEIAKEYKKACNGYLYSFEMDFVSVNRIPSIGKIGVLCSSDVDVEFISNLIEVYKQIGAL